MRKINKAGLDLIKEFESLRLNAYPDPATGGEPVTIGYGHTGGVKMGDKITPAQADAFLQSDCERFERGLSSLVPASLTDNEFSALVSLVFNIGLGNFQTSTLLKLINANKKTEAAEQFLVWNKARVKGVLTPMAGLTRRREAEKALFLKKS